MKRLSAYFQLYRTVPFFPIAIETFFIFVLRRTQLAVFVLTLREGTRLTIFLSL